MGAKRRLFEESWNEAMPLHIVHVLLLQGPLSAPQPQAKFGVVGVAELPIVVAVLLRHEPAATLIHNRIESVRPATLTVSTSQMSILR